MKNLNAYMTIEAALIIPMVLGTYLILIFASFYLYTKCTLAQDGYIKSYRASTFNYWEDGYGEVAYGELARRSGSVGREYIESRRNYDSYPFFSLDDEKIISVQAGFLTPEIYVMLGVKGRAYSFLTRDYTLNVTKSSSITNPVTNIRIVRRNERNDGNEIP